MILLMHRGAFLHLTIKKGSAGGPLDAREEG